MRLLMMDRPCLSQLSADFFIAYLAIYNISQSLGSAFCSRFNRCKFIFLHIFFNVSKMQLHRSLLLFLNLKINFTCCRNFSLFYSILLDEILIIPCLTWKRHKLLVLICYNFNSETRFLQLQIPRSVARLFRLNENTIIFNLLVDQNNDGIMIISHVQCQSESRLPISHTCIH